MPVRTRILEQHHFVLNPALPAPGEMLRCIEYGGCCEQAGELMLGYEDQQEDVDDEEEDDRHERVPVPGRLGAVPPNEVLLPILMFFERHTPVCEPFSVLWSGPLPSGFFRGHMLPLRITQRFASVEDLNELNAALEEKTPMPWKHWNHRDRSQPYLFGKALWTLTSSEMALNEEQLQLVFFDAIDKEREKFERLKRKFSGNAGDRMPSKRELIPESVRIFVWRRDEGKCVQCGSRERLEYDHVIPVCKGGSSTARNIQLLCEQCNRKKRDSI